MSVRFFVARMVRRVAALLMGYPVPTCSLLEAMRNISWSHGTVRAKMNTSIFVALPKKREAGGTTPSGSLGLSMNHSSMQMPVA
ncbi:hypothetical protein D3C72_1979860 [compost metagenome]